MVGMNELPASPKKPSAASQELMLTSAQHAKLAAFYARPDPSLSPELAQWRQRLAHYHMSLSRTALKQEEAKVPHVVSDPLAPCQAISR
jgi:hypothetical protein